MLSLLIWIYLLYQINWHATADGKVVGEERCLLHLMNISLHNLGALHKNEWVASNLNEI